MAYGNHYNEENVNGKCEMNHKPRPCSHYTNFAHRVTLSLKSVSRFKTIDISFEACSNKKNVFTDVG